ncbi:MAG: RhuM family protein [Pseudomonadota bacterium]|nr:RhuM family protein [Pseudomonadota bacterium]
MSAELQGLSAVVIYQTDSGETRLEVQLDQDTVWLNLNQMTRLFGRDKSVVSRHLNNIFREDELERQAVVANFATTATDGKTYQVDYFNLDVIISVGYRVRSVQGTRFRQWATQTLRNHIVQGYTINQQRLEEQAEKFIDMQRAVELLSRTLEQQQLVNDIGKDVLQVITDYAYALTTLDRYDHGALTLEDTSGPATFVLEYKEAISIVRSMKDESAGIMPKMG